MTHSAAWKFVNPLSSLDFSVVFPRRSFCNITSFRYEMLASYLSIPCICFEGTVSITSRLHETWNQIMEIYGKVQSLIDSGETQVGAQVIS